MGRGENHSPIAASKRAPSRAPLKSVGIAAAGEDTCRHRFKGYNRAPARLCGSFGIINCLTPADSSPLLRPPYRFCPLSVISFGVSAAAGMITFSAPPTLHHNFAEANPVFSKYSITTS
ncbi:MAG: hypothetical protein RL514_4361 [Verrucomicrobiota bacterium]